MTLSIPNTSIVLSEGAVIRLRRFDSETWRVLYGWYTWGGNRPTLGWYLVSERNPQRTKPVQLSDMYDIYVVDSGGEPKPDPEIEDGSVTNKKLAPMPPLTVKMNPSEDEWRSPEDISTNHLSEFIIFDAQDAGKFLTIGSSGTIVPLALSTLTGGNYGTITQE